MCPCLIFGLTLDGMNGTSMVRVVFSSGTSRLARSRQLVPWYELSAYEMSVVRVVQIPVSQPV